VEGFLINHGEGGEGIL